MGPRAAGQALIGRRKQWLSSAPRPRAGHHWRRRRRRRAALRRAPISWRRALASGRIIRGPYRWQFGHSLKQIDVSASARARPALFKNASAAERRGAERGRGWGRHRRFRFRWPESAARGGVQLADAAGPAPPHCVVGRTEKDSPLCVQDCQHASGAEFKERHWLGAGPLWRCTRRQWRESCAPAPAGSAPAARASLRAPIERATDTSSLLLAALAFASASSPTPTPTPTVVVRGYSYDLGKARINATRRAGAPPSCLSAATRPGCSAAVPHTTLQVKELVVSYQSDHIDPKQAPAFECLRVTQSYGIQSF